MDTFACGRCGAVLTAPVSRVALPAYARLTYGNGRHMPVLMESGTYAVDPEPFGPPWRQWSEIYEGEAEARGVFAPVYALSFGAPGHIVLAPGDAHGTVLIPERNEGFCCGLDGRDGPNLACACCGQEVATRIDDCSLWQATWLEPTAARRVPAGPARPILAWQTLAEERRSTSPVEANGSWSPRWETAASVTLARLVAASDGSPVTVPGGLLADIFRRSLDALLPPGAPASAQPWLDRDYPLPIPPRTSPWSRSTRRPASHGPRPPASPPRRSRRTCGCTSPSTTNACSSPPQANCLPASSATTRYHRTPGGGCGPSSRSSFTPWPACPPSANRGCAPSTTAAQHCSARADSRAARPISNSRAGYVSRAGRGPVE